MKPIVALLVALVSLVGQPVAAQDNPIEQRANDVLSALRHQRPVGEVFTPEFLSAVPEAQLFALVESLQSENGPLRGADEIKPTGPTAGRFLLRFERANANVLIELDQAAPHKVTGLRITAVTPLDDGPPRLLADFAALPGEKGFALVRLDDDGPHPVLSYNPARQYAIGSTFKLWVLDAVAEEVAVGRLRWDQVVHLGKRSFPSGVTQNWPEDAPVTVETLATLMISVSDNTATDTLMRLMGRDKIAARVIASGHDHPERTLPFLTTREAFALKARPQAEIAAYAAKDHAARSKQLDGLAAESDGINSAQPVAINVAEWFASSNDIAGILDNLRKRSDPRIMAILGVNPSLPPDTRSRFRKIAYKGGSEPGVISQSWLLQAPDGRWFVATASWNNPERAVDNQRFELLMMRLIEQIH